MKTIRLKTNIKCSGCIATVTPFLNEALGNDAWQVDTNDPLKILTVNTEVSETNVIEAIQKAGYKAEKL